MSRQGKHISGLNTIPLSVFLMVLLSACSAEGITLRVGADVPEPGGFFRNGGDVQFDRGSLSVNGGTYTGSAAGTLPRFTIGLQNVGGIDVTGRVDLFSPNGTAVANTFAAGREDFVYARQLFTFNNPRSTPVTAFVSPSYDLGSDFFTIVDSTSSGDTAVIAADIWVVTDDNGDGGPGGSRFKPAVALLLADGQAVLPTLFSQPVSDVVTADFVLRLRPGESQSLMFFIASRNATDTFPQTASRAQSRADIEALLADPALQFAGLTAAEAAWVINFLPEPTSLVLLSLAGCAFSLRRSHRRLS